MSKLMNIGFGNVVNTDKIISVLKADSAPAKRFIQNAKAGGTLLDATSGRKTKSLILTDSGHIILSALQPETIMARFNGEPYDVRGEENE